MKIPTRDLTDVTLVSENTDKDKYDEDEDDEDEEDEDEDEDDEDEDALAMFPGDQTHSQKVPASST